MVGKRGHTTHRMKFFSLLCLSTIAIATPLGSRQSQPQGIDVSGFQPNVDFNQVKANSISFAFIKATEGTSKRSQEYVETYCNISRLAFRSDTFSNQYTGATNAGIIRGAYHFAHPDSSSGAAQANFFIDNGGVSAIYSISGELGLKASRWVDQ